LIVSSAKNLFVVSAARPAISDDEVGYGLQGGVFVHSDGSKYPTKLDRVGFTSLFRLSSQQIGYRHPLKNLDCPCVLCAFKAEPFVKGGFSSQGKDRRVEIAIGVVN
jgi:hypothetical protein